MNSYTHTVDADWFETVDRCWCGGVSDQVSPHSPDYRVCGRCGAHFSTSRLKPGFVSQFYSYDGYWHRRQQGKQHPTLWEREHLFSSEADGRVQLWLEIIHRHTGKRSGTAVEAGCAEGTLLQRLREKGWQTVGIEPDARTAAAVRERTGLDIRAGAFPGQPAPPCDLFVACDVFEHIADPLCFLQAVHAALRADGLLFLQLPLMEEHQPDFGHMNEKVFDVQEHVFIYSRRAVATVLETAGFAVIENDAAWRRAHEIVVARKLERPARPLRHLANLPQMFSPEWTRLIDRLNAFGAPHGLRQFTNWSKLWEYPWLWHHGLSALNWRGLRVLDLGSEQSPFPWWLATLGAKVTLVETRADWINQWENIRRALGGDKCGTDHVVASAPTRLRWPMVGVAAFEGAARKRGAGCGSPGGDGCGSPGGDECGSPGGDECGSLGGAAVDWRIVGDCRLPFPAESFDVVTSFSVIEHQDQKELAVAEVVRVLKPGGLFGISFDICEPELGMAFPEWNGRALTRAEFESLVWRQPAFASGGLPQWNDEDIGPFLRWHRTTAPHHNYLTGAAILTKAPLPWWRRWRRTFA